MIPAAMLAHRIMGIMAHWREYMGKRAAASVSVTLLTAYSRTRQTLSTVASLHRADDCHHGRHGKDMKRWWSVRLGVMAGTLCRRQLSVPEEAST